MSGKQPRKRKTSAILDKKEASEIIIAQPIISARSSEFSLAEENEFISLFVKARNVNRTNEHGETLIYFAAKEGRVSDIFALKAAGADVNKPNNRGETPVWAAAKGGHAGAIAVLKMLGADVNKKENSNQRRSPADIAAAKGHVAALYVLSMIGAEGSVNLGGKHDNYLSCTEVKNGLGVILALKTANANRPEGWWEPELWLLDAAQNGRVETVTGLLAAGTDPNHSKYYPSYGTPLSAAAAEGHADIIAVLVGAGADVNQANAEGITPLIAAVSGVKDDAMTISALIRAGANLNQPNKNGEMPLDIAIKNQHAEAVRILKAYAAKQSEAVPGEQKDPTRPEMLTQFQDKVRDSFQKRGKKETEKQAATANTFEP